MKQKPDTFAPGLLFWQPISLQSTHESLAVFGYRISISIANGKTMSIGNMHSIFFPLKVRGGRGVIIKSI